MIGIGFHSFIGGIVYSIVVTISIFTGFIATTGIVLNEFPEGIITYLLLLKGGFTERSAMIMTFFAAALTTPFGMLFSYLVSSEIDSSMIGTLLALSAGALIYAGATHLLKVKMAAISIYSYYSINFVNRNAIEMEAIAKTLHTI